MLKVIAIITAAGIAGALGAGVVIAKPGAPPAELLSDLAAVRTEIVAAEADNAKFGGLLGVMAGLRLQVLRSTEATLDQRRQSFLYGIKIDYREDTPAHLVSPEDAARIQQDMDAANADLAAAEAEAGHYSGGLLQTMALLRAATARATLATVRQQQAFARYGIPLPNLAGVWPGSGGQASTPGKPVSDRDALQ